MGGQAGPEVALWRKQAETLGGAQALCTSLGWGLWGSCLALLGMCVTLRTRGQEGWALTPQVAVRGQW